MLRYGRMRQLVLGLEAVLPNGEVWNGLKRLRKDNTGYDLKQLLIGAEGTLGVVTAAALKLFPMLASRAVAMAGVESPGAAVALLARAKEVSGGAVESFELIGALGLELAIRHIPGARAPLESRPPWYVLIEIASGEPGAAEASMERLLEGAMEAARVDAAIACDRGAGGRSGPAREPPAPRRAGRGVKTTSPCRSPASPSSSIGAGSARGCRGRIDAFGHRRCNIHYDASSALAASGWPQRPARGGCAPGP